MAVRLYMQLMSKVVKARDGMNMARASDLMYNRHS
jgi:hypothetical protein